MKLAIDLMFWFSVITLPGFLIYFVITHVIPNLISRDGQ